MQNIALIAIVVLVIILALIFVLMRRNQAADVDVFEDEPLLPNAGHDNLSANQPPPSFSAERQSPQYAATAKQLIAQQRYDEAEAELIRGVRTQPNNTQLKLELLNLYAQTTNANKFNQVYAQIQQSGDAGIMNEAHHIKSLLDAEIQAQQKSQQPTSSPSVAPTQTQATKPADNMGLDFDTDNFNHNSDDGVLDFEDESVQEQSNNAFNLEDLEADLLGSATAPISDDTDSALNFDFNDNEPTKSSPVKTSTANEDTDTGLDFDFAIKEDSDSDDTALSADTSETGTLSFDISEDNNLSADLTFDEQNNDTSISDNTSTDTQTDLDLDFDLSFDDKSSVADKVETVDSVEPNSTVAADDDLDFDLDLSTQKDNTLATEEKSATEQTDDFLLDDSLDFNLDDDNSSDDTDLTSSNQSITTDEVQLEDGFDFEEFGLDETPSESQTKTQAAQDFNQISQISEQDFDLDFDNDLNFDVSDKSDTGTDTQKPSSESAQSTDSIDDDTNEFMVSDDLDTDFDLDDFSFDADNSLDTDDNLSESAPAAMETDIASDVSETPVKPTIQLSENLNDFKQEKFDSDFTDIAELDNAQVTINLAQQYINLGEYDSARRLLTEVTQSADETHLATAKNLLAQIN